MLTVLHGHSLEKLRQMPDESVHCFVTSPPYWQLRDYSVPPQIWGGLEACAHNWDPWVEKHDEREPTVNGKSRTSDRFYQEDSRQFNGNHQKHTAGQFCKNCGAWNGCYGLEPTIELFIKHTLEIFTEARRVLRRDGTLWLNLGDSYSSVQTGRPNTGLKALSDRTSPRKKPRENHAYQDADNLFVKHGLASGLKAKDLIGMPWRVAFALQAAGWYLRCDIIWEKPNPMPESVTDRPTKSHEYIFLLTKSPRYFYDAEAIKEAVTGEAHARSAGYKTPDGWDTTSGNGDHGAFHKNGREKGHNGYKSKRAPGVTPKSAPAGSGIKANESFHEAVSGLVSSRNKRSVWTIATEPFPQAHFATFPRELPKLCILAGTSARGCCSKCGAPWERNIELGEPDLAHQRACGGDSSGEYHGQATKDFGSAGAQDASSVKARILAGMVQRKTVGWLPTCECGSCSECGEDRKGRALCLCMERGEGGGAKWVPYSTIPCTVGDMFGGSGTTGEVALELGRSAVLIELNEKYLPLIDQRCHVTPGLALA